MDNHVIWVDPSNTDHMLAGCDGGVYETFDAAKSWNFKANLPVAQFYRVTVDDSSPVYNVYGGMQDNSSVGGPSRTLTENGITNQDWFFTFGGDGFTSKVEPGNPNIVYALLQYGIIARYDRKTGEDLGIQPQEGAGQPPLRWNWDAPLIISPFSPTRLYFGANILFRSDDRGSTWKAISPDLTRQLDRNTLKVMGKVWAPDAVAKDQSTSIFGNIVALDESPLTEGLLYVGTDDGLVQVSEDGGATWRKDEKFPGVPDMTYVSDLTASPHDANMVYAAFNNHKMGDFKPYLLKSADRGKTWTSIAGNLPERGSVWTVAEDPDDANLLFAGTEFGLFFTKDGGKDWIQLKGGLPTIAVRDMAFQRREHDLVLATFGRGLYILDDYTPLEAARPADLDQAFTDFSVRRTLGYIPSIPLGMKGKAFFGESFFMAPNPPYGAVFTYYLKDGLKTKKELRHEAEQAAMKKGETIKYPTDAEFEAEAREPAPEVLITVKDAAGNVVRKMTGPVGEGFHRVAWNLRFAPSTPTSLEPGPTDDPFYESADRPDGRAGQVHRVLPDRGRRRGHGGGRARDLRGGGGPPGHARAHGPRGARGLPGEDGEPAARGDGRELGRARGARPSRLRAEGVDEHAEGRSEAVRPGARPGKPAEGRAEGDRWRPGEGAAQRADADVDLGSRQPDRRRPVGVHFAHHRHQPAGVRHRRGPVRPRARDAASDHRRRHEAARLGAGAGRRAVDAGPGAGVEEVTDDQGSGGQRCLLDFATETGRNALPGACSLEPDLHT